jgi:hypothetical protein
VFFVLKAICVLVFLNNSVIALVFLPIYVNVAHFRVASGVVFVGFLFLCESI